MNASLERRLTALETAQAPGSQRRYLLMPWELMPASTEGDPVGLENVIALLPYGDVHTEYVRNGIHPRDDAPGSWNRHLYFGEPLNA